MFSWLFKFIAGIFAASIGALIGALLERRVVTPQVRQVAEDSEAWGSLHASPIHIKASDDELLYAELDRSVSLPDDLTVIFAHGYVVNLDVFHYQRKALRPVAKLGFYDQRGHGKSGRGERSTHTIQQLGTDLEKVIQTLAPTGSIVLVGHSMGAMAIQALAGRRPEWFGPRIKSIVLTCTSSGGLTEVPLGLPPGMTKFVQGVAPSVTSALAGKPHVIERGVDLGSDLALLLNRRYSFASEVPSGLNNFVAKMHGSTSLEVIGDFLAAFGKYDSTLVLPILARVPTFVVGAEKDLMTPIEHSAQIAAAIDGSEFIAVSDAGHMLPLEKPDVLNDIIHKAISVARNSIA
jgi:pimeloyl-ACP methyl ester carboxylesterase